MSDNLRIWNALSKTDPKHTKAISRPGGFKGTATKPIWLNKRLTEHFGPAGTGWGMGQPEFQTVNAGEEILVFCTVSLWYREGEAIGTVYGVGGDKVLSKRASGAFTNDEAFKASYTDALSNAMKQIGVSADIHMGQFEDQKYVREMTAEFAGEAAPAPMPVASSAHGRELAAADAHLVDNTRAKGALPKDAAAPDEGAIKKIEWVKKSIAALRTMNAPAAQAWWKAEAARIAIIETKLPTEHERLLDAYNVALEKTVELA